MRVRAEAKPRFTKERAAIMIEPSTEQPTGWQGSHPGTTTRRFDSRHFLLLASVLLLGLLARTWEYRGLPPGLNSDEASIGVEAWNLYHYGVDRNGISFPVHFIAWGSGQNALYGYLLVPFVGLLGLKPAVVRLPMLISGILSLPLMYAVGMSLWGRRGGLLATFALAVSPWHILLSRWGLESNILPFVFLLGFACLLRTRSGNGWFIAACVLFGLCLYAYGTAYAVVPVFMLCALTILFKNRVVRARVLWAGLLSFSVVATPILLMLIVNTFRFPELTVGPFTIPRFPVEARYEAATIFGTPELLATVLVNLMTAARLLVTETDGLAYNVVEPYGVFYRLSLPLAALGILLMIRAASQKPSLETQLLWGWLAAACSVSIFQSVNINRFNIVYPALLLCCAYALIWLESRGRGALPGALVLLSLAFAGFTAAYHGDSYRRLAEWKFNAGLLPALGLANSLQTERVCVTDKVTMPYIFALFSAPTDSAVFIETVEYMQPPEPLRRVTAFGRYTFGTHNCSGGESVTYVLAADEIPPRLGNRFQYAFFDNFVVYYPR
jgi:4-amino-4-deoxy-L-arabinose transferase-like glycosyltransferase